jgi:type II secretory pathway pseudopilin PulG
MHLFNKTNNAERGFSLVEVTIGILILALLGVTFMEALSTAVTARNTADVRTTAESLATGQFEKIKSGAYSVATAGSANYTSTIPTLPDGYRFATVDTDNNTVIDNIFGIPWNLDSDIMWTESSPADPGIQKITIIVQSRTEISSKGVYKEVFRLTDFKVNR